MEAKDIYPFVESVKKVFDTMLTMKVEALNARLKPATETSYDVSGIIGMSGEVTGAVVLSLPQQTASRIVTIFTGMQVEPGDVDFADAIGELVNMITGSAKAQFEGRHIDISCPSVVVGAQHRVLQHSRRPIIEIPCECECGPFSVLVTMRDATEPQEQESGTVSAA